MFGLPPPPLEPVRLPGSGAAKRARRNEFPQTFLAALPATGGISVIGVFVANACEQFAEHSADVVGQYHNLIGAGGPPNPASYCVWSLENAHQVENGPFVLTNDQLRYRSVVFSGLTPESLLRVQNSSILVGGQSVSLGDVLRLNRVRIFMLPSSEMADNVFQQGARRLVTTSSYATQAGIIVAPCVAPPAHEGEVCEERPDTR